MPLYALGDQVPQIDPTAFVHPDAVIIGDVVIGPQSSVWPCAVLRGDAGGIRIGARSSIQDGSVLHCTPSHPTVVGDDCVIGHIVHLEGCTIEDGSLVGNGAVVLPQAIIRSHAIVGANALVPTGMEVPSGMMALGVPAKLRDGGDATGVVKLNADVYVTRAALYRDQLRRLD